MSPRSTLAIALTAAVLAGPARAGDVGVRLSVAGGGSLSLAYDPAALGKAVRNGNDQSLTYALPLIVIDSRSTGAGWNLTVASTSFDAAAGTSFDPDAALITSTRVACLTGGGCTAPRNLIDYPVSLPANASEATPIKVFDADQASGMGFFSVTPTVAVSIPGDVRTGSYVSTVAVAIVSGP